MNRKRVSFFSTLKYLVYLLIVVLFSLELILRVYNPFPKRLKGDKIVLEVNQRIHMINNRIKPLEKEILYSRNSLGFRGPEKPADFPDHLTIVAVGGSTTECYFVSDSLTWSYVLGAKLNDALGNVWMNNAGLDGHSTYGHQVLLDDYLVQLKPDAILFLVGCNDVERDDLNSYDKRFISKGLKGTLEKSELFVLMKNIRRTMLATKMKVAHSYKPFEEITDDTLSFPPVEIKKVLDDQKLYLELYRQRLDKLIQTCRLHGIEPILITQPSLFGTGIDSISGLDLERVDLKRNYNGEIWWKRLELYNAVTKQAGHEAGVKVIDLATQMPKSSLYFYDALHFTVPGCKKVSEILFQELTTDTLFLKIR